MQTDYATGRWPLGVDLADFNLDGWPDILQANGHVERTYASDKPDLMLPQYFKNVGQGKFVELSSRSLGPYFQKSYLGRTVAVLDWNCDGKDDACVTHLEVPIALLTNRTKATGHYLAVRLSGVESNRDAFGAVVQVTAGGRTWMRPMASRALPRPKASPKGLRPLCASALLTME